MRSTLGAMVRPLLLLAVLSGLAALPAQDAASITVQEQKLDARAVSGLHAIANAYQTQKQHGKALALRRELLTEYSAGDEEALDKSGFSKVGDQWRADPQKLVIEKDLPGNARELKKVDRDWAALQKELLTEHRALAEAWTKVGDASHAMRHWRRVMRFAPNDKRALEMLALQRFEGFGGTDEELGILRRDRSIRGAVDWLLRKQFVIKKLEGKQPLFEKAGIAHQGFRSEHFAVWGTLPEAQLQLVAQHAERALLFCHTLLGTYEGMAFAPARLRDILLVADDGSYTRILDQCANQFDPERLAFLKKDVDLAYLDVDGKSVRFYKTNGGEPEALDQSVRGVVQDAVGVLSDGLWEGVGHASCGWFFGRTLTYMLEQQTSKTVASGSQQMLVPDMATWSKIAEQSAWAKSDTRTSQLVLISAARFTVEQRVKAWAMVDYLMHWRPDLLRELDLSQTKDIHSPPDVENEFQRRTSQSLPAIDEQWRQFWGKSDELHKAMASDPLGDPKGKDRAMREQSRAIVDAVNEARVAAMRGPVGFHFSEDVGTLAALHYADEVVSVERANAKKPKVPVPMPELPTTIGKTTLWERGNKPAEAVARWLCRPAWRDALMHPGRGLLGAQQGKNAFALDLSDPAVPTRQGLPLCWPRHHQVDVSGRALVADLGPRAIEALGKAGKQPTDTVGMPLSVHFARAMQPLDLGMIVPTVYRGNQRVAGVLVKYQGEGPEDDVADGCLAFVPLEPLESGSEIEVTWTVPPMLLKKQETFPAVRFLVR
jgi:tetratricopeptide (TPR) repeat protein